MQLLRVSVGLNLCFLIGERHSRSVLIESKNGKMVDRLDEFLRRQGRGWEAPKAELARAATAADEILGLLESGGHLDGPVTASISYDDLYLVISVAYQGSLPQLASQQRLSVGLIEEQIFISGLTGALSSIHAHRLDSACNDQVQVDSVFPDLHSVSD